MSRDFIEHGLNWSWTPARVQCFIAGADSCVVVARRGGRAFGDPRHGTVPHGSGRRGIDAFAIMRFGEEAAHLNLLAVAPEHRRQGVGRQIMDWLAETAEIAGVFRINLELRQQNHPARAFYHRLGFVESGVMPGYYPGGEAALRMCRRLGKLP